MSDTPSLEQVIRKAWSRRYPNVPVATLDAAVRTSLEGVHRALRGDSSFDEAARRGARIHRMLSSGSD